MKEKKKGVFIVFEGIDGCGKSTAASLVRIKLEEQGFPVVTTREPGGTNCPTAEKIREILLHSSSPLNPETEMLLFAASRSQHREHFILPMLKEGWIVISDRFLWSSLIYQGVGRNLGMNLVGMINAPAVKDLSPDIIIFFDLPVETAWERIKEDRKKQLDRFERGGIPFLRKLNRAYRKLAENDQRVIRIDAQLSKEKLAEAIFREIIKRIPSLTYFQDIQRGR